MRRDSITRFSRDMPTRRVRQVTRVCQAFLLLSFTSWGNAAFISFTRAFTLS